MAAGSLATAAAASGPYLREEGGGGTISDFMMRDRFHEHDF